MATRAMIIMKDVEADRYRGIYCHFDGNPEHTGSLLLHHYYTPEKVKALIELGDLSTLGDDCNNPVAYHRDRGEKLRIATDYHIAGFEVFDYTYLYENGEWHYRAGKRPFSLLATRGLKAL